mmetsp:Transcript_3854/g.7080  ORF Transcript_3854/g.7080 Transcript_3854/m.7080 type:complete len:86 (-) Transcript_3854:188-445(-)
MKILIAFGFIVSNFVSMCCKRKHISKLGSFLHGFQLFEFHAMSAYYLQYTTFTFMKVISLSGVNLGSIMFIFHNITNFMGQCHAN